MCRDEAAVLLRHQSIRCLLYTDVAWRPANDDVVAGVAYDFEGWMMADCRLLPDRRQPLLLSLPFQFFQKPKLLHSFFLLLLFIPEIERVLDLSFVSFSPRICLQIGDEHLHNIHATRLANVVGVLVPHSTCVILLSGFSRSVFLCNIGR